MCMNFPVKNITLFIDKDIPALHFDVLCWVFQNIQLKYSLINLTYTHIWLLCVHFRGITCNTVGTLTKYKFYLGMHTYFTYPSRHIPRKSIQLYPTHPSSEKSSRGQEESYDPIFDVLPCLYMLIKDESISRHAVV